MSFQSLITKTGRYKSRFQPDDRRPRSKRRKHHQSSTSARPLHFSEKLAAAAIGDAEKVSPLYTDRPNDNGEKAKPTIRIRALQHMVVLHLRRVIAGEVAEILDAQSATPDMMERARKTMKQYGQLLPWHILGI